jgi:hypothetical protein
MGHPPGNGCIVGAAIEVEARRHRLMTDLDGLAELVKELIAHFSHAPKRIRQKCDDDCDEYWVAPDGERVTITVHNTGACLMVATIARTAPAGSVELKVKPGQSKSASGVFTSLAVTCEKADEGKCSGTYEIEK